jgi:hypothetical protein
MTTSTWYHVGVAVNVEKEDDPAKNVKAKIRFWSGEGNTAALEETNAGSLASQIFLDANTSGSPILGAKNGNGVQTQHLIGFIYSVYFRNTAMITTGSTFVIDQATCDSKCWAGKCAKETTHCLSDHDFDQYETKDSCDKTSCNDTGRGCVRPNECQPTTKCEDGFEYCHLCYDFECTKCTDYYEGDCVDTKCSYSGLADEAAGKCSCIVDTGRDNPDYDNFCQWTDCHTHCKYCNIPTKQSDVNNDYNNYN